MDGFLEERLQGIPLLFSTLTVVPAIARCLSLPVLAWRMEGSVIKVGMNDMIQGFPSAHLHLDGDGQVQII